MPRRAKPFPHQGHYYTSIGGKQRRLCRIEDGMERAEEELRKLQSERFQTGQLFPEMTVAEAAALFLRQVETDKGPAHKTFQFYKRNLQRLVDRLGSRKLRSLRQTDGVEYKRHLLEARRKPTGRRPGQKLGRVQEPRPLGNVTVNHHLRAAKTLLNWAVESDYIVKNPWKGKKLKLLEEKGRERLVTPEEFKALLDHCTNDDFRDILTVLRYTAARPEDVRHLTWEMVHFDKHCWLIPASKHKTGHTQREKNKSRIVGMIPLVEDILKKRQTASSSPFVFPKPDGKAWDAAGLSLKFRRLRERAGIVEKDGEQLVLYSKRHTRLTELAPTLAAPVLQEVGGHTTFQTTKRYIHIASDVMVNELRAAPVRLDQPK